MDRAAVPVAEDAGGHGSEKAAIEQAAGGKLHLELRKREVTAQREQSAVDDSGIEAEEQAGKRAGESDAIEVA